MDNSITIKELSIDGSPGPSRGEGIPFIASGWGIGGGIKFDWCLRGETWEGRGADELGGIKFGGCDGIKFGGTQAYPVAPGFLGETWGGSSSNIEGDIPIIEGADELGGIKFGEDQFCGEERTGIWPSGGGGRNIDPTDTVEFGGSDFVWPPGDTSPGPKAGEPEGS